MVIPNYKKTDVICCSTKKRERRLRRRLHLWMLAIRDSFVSLLPLTFVYVIAQLATHLPYLFLGDYSESNYGQLWLSTFEHISTISHDVFPLLLSACIVSQLTYELPSKNRDRPLFPSFLLMIYVVVNLVVASTVLGIDILEFSVKAMFLALIIGVASAEFLSLALDNPKLDLLHVPADSDTKLYFVMRILPAMTLILTIITLVSFLWLLLPDVAHPLDSLIHWAQGSGYGSWLLSISAVLINQVFWFIGVHGGLVLDLIANGTLFDPQGFGHLSSDWANRTVFNHFVLIGGTGTTMGLLIAIFIVSKKGLQRKIAKISLLPSFFNINDILLFGLPIVFNPIYLLPFIAVPLLMILLALGALDIGFISLDLTASVRWTTPPLISGWLITNSWHGAFLQLICIGISTLCYLPFVRRAEALRLIREQSAFHDATQTIISSGHKRQQIVTREDKVGMIARELVLDLKQAVKQDELTLSYQPKHDAGGAIIGVEALIRWQHPRYGFVSPLMIITLAEDSGVIHSLGRWVIEQSCACKSRWNKLGYKNLSMAVNVSPIQLTDKDLPNFINNCIGNNGLLASELELEITESSEIPDDELTDFILDKLSATGVKLAMDDFGMGYSSLLHMRRFQVAAIKIDGSITREVLTNQMNADIVRTIASLGKSQGVQVVAEYVETLEQRQALSNMGCDVFQGYYHSPPLNETDCVAYFLTHQKKVD